MRAARKARLIGRVAGRISVDFPVDARAFQPPAVAPVEKHPPGSGKPIERAHKQEMRGATVRHCGGRDLPDRLEYVRDDKTRSGGRHRGSACGNRMYSIARSPVTALAPTQSEPPFIVAQLAVLAISPHSA